LCKMLAYSNHTMDHSTATTTVLVKVEWIWTSLDYIHVLETTTKSPEVMHSGWR